MSRTEKFLGTLILLVMLGLIGVFSYFLIFSQLKQADQKMYQKILIASDLSDFDKTLEHISDFLVEYPDSAYRNKVMVQAAVTLYRKKDYSAAREYAIRVLGSENLPHEEFVDAVLVLGWILRDTGKFDSITLDYLENAYLKVRDVKRQDVAVELGFAYLYKKDYENALSRFNEGTDEWALTGQYMVYLAQDNYPLAIDRFEEFFRRFPASERFAEVKQEFLKHTYYYAGTLQTRKRYEEALQYYLKIVNQFRDTNFYDAALFQIGEIYYLNRKYSAAEEFYNRVTANTIFYSDDAALFRLGELAYEQDKKARALSTFQKIIKDYPASGYLDQSREWARLISKELGL